jgi:hypothetical protein
MLVEGFEHRQMMTMMNYNQPYLPEMLEAMGFEKEVDFISCYAEPSTFQMPERVYSIADRVEKKGVLTVKRFTSKKELKAWAPRIGRTYNQSFINNWEYYPLTDHEIKFVVDNILTVADHRLIKIILHGEDVVGFMFAFPDLSPAAVKGAYFLRIADILLELRRKVWVSINGAGFSEFQAWWNALMYAEMGGGGARFWLLPTLDSHRWRDCGPDANDLINLGGKPYKESPGVSQRKSEMSLFSRGSDWLGIAAVGRLVLCIRRSLAYGRASGLLPGLGAATADASTGHCCLWS